jgi:hypothetical protein
MTEPRERYVIVDGIGRRVSRLDELTLGWLGDYEVRADEERQNFYVICSPEQRKEGRWNYTRFELEDGSLIPADGHVELDPYHMCLLYQLVENLKERT